MEVDASREYYRLPIDMFSTWPNVAQKAGSTVLYCMENKGFLMMLMHLALIADTVALAAYVPVYM